MSTRYPTTNPLDRIFLGIASLVIVSADAVAIYHCVITSLDPPPYAATAVEIFPPLQNALVATMVEGSAPASIHCVPAVIVR